VTTIDSDREAPQRREGRREDERGMVEISGQRSEPVAFRRRQDGPRILPSALIPSLRCSLWGVRAALGYGLDQKGGQKGHISTFNICLTPQTVDSPNVEY
jgi:hypothetical protein